MSLFEGFNTRRLVKVSPSLLEQLERWGAAVHHKAVITRLRRFREQLERDMAPGPWLALDAPMVLLLSDLCDALGLSEQERARVLGCEGVLALADTLEVSVQPVLKPRLPMNEQQAKVLVYVREHGTIMIAVYRQLCPFWSSETPRLDLANLVARGLLVKNGRKKGTCYTLPTRGGSVIKMCLERTSGLVCTKPHGGGPAVSSHSEVKGAGPRSISNTEAGEV